MMNKLVERRQKQERFVLETAEMIRSKAVESGKYAAFLGGLCCTLIRDITCKAGGKANFRLSKEVEHLHDEVEQLVRVFSIPESENLHLLGLLYKELSSSVVSFTGKAYDQDCKDPERALGLKK